MAQQDPFSPTDTRESERSGLFIVCFTDRWVGEEVGGEMQASPLALAHLSQKHIRTPLQPHQTQQLPHGLVQRRAVDQSGQGVEREVLAGSQVAPQAVHRTDHSHLERGHSTADGGETTAAGEGSDAGPAVTKREETHRDRAIASEGNFKEVRWEAHLLK